MPKLVSFLRFSPLLALAASLAGCADRNPAAVEPAPPPSPRTLAALTCTARVQAKTVVCRDATPSGGALGDLIVGTPYVKLASSGVAYDPALERFRFDVTLQNLMAQPIGTTDGSTVAPAGIRVFFHSGPTVTEGPGAISVFNADGTAAFTAADQPYFRYDTLLASGETSAAKEWIFSVPVTVNAFQFVLYVSAPVPNEVGTLVVDPPAPQVLVGAQLPLTAVVRTGAGGLIRSAPVAWSSSDTLVATVDAAGVVTGLALGEATITATSGGRTGTATLSVSASDTHGASLIDFSLSVDSLDLSAGADSVVAWIEMADGGVGVRSVSVFLLSPHFNRSCLSTLTGGTGARGTWRCAIAMPAYVDNGVFDVMVAALDSLNNSSSYNAVELAARGFDHGVVVTGSTTDTVPPELTGFAFSPDTVNVDTAAASVGFSLSATDAGTGVSRVEFRLRSPTLANERLCLASRSSGTAASGTWTCSIELEEDVEGGSWSAVALLTDGAGQDRFVSTSDLQTGGFPTRVEVISPGANTDATPPTVDDFTLAPDTVNVGADSATVTFGITASDAGQGVRHVTVYLFNPSVTNIVSCAGTLTSGTAASGTWNCSLKIPRFAETGEWTVRLFVDDGYNTTLLTPSGLQAAGFPTSVFVTS